MATSPTTGTRFECGFCLAEMSGYTWSELASEGWKVHHQAGVSFTMCDACEREYEIRREANRAFAA
jgi:transcription elongation factor Elf1